MKTQKLFKGDVYLRNAESAISGVLNLDGKTLITLKETLFFPEGGGQSCDKGAVIFEDGTRFEVVDVYEKDDEIYHEIDLKGCAKLPEIIKEGAKLKLELDWERRFDNMQRHCGEHILTGIFFREYGVINRGFHMGDQYMTIDLAIEEDATVNTIDWEMCKKAELLTNEVIHENLPMIIRHFDTFEEASKEPMRKKLTIKEDITLVGIAKPEYDWGCVACCGTHPETTGQVGMVKIFKIESNKGMFRVYFEAGRRAFVKYQEEFDTLISLGKRLSAGTEDMLSKYDAMVEKNKERGSQLHLLKKEVISREAGSIVSALKDPAALDESGFPVRNYNILTLDDLTQLARAIGPEVKKLAFLVHEPSNTILLVSDGKIDCGKLVKENASIYNGKGGGNNTMARAIFAKDEYIETFIDLIEKHLR